MRLRLGCKITHQFAQPTPLIALLRVHEEHAGALERPDFLLSDPAVPLHFYKDGFGNSCCRMVAPAGSFTLMTDGIIQDSGEFEQAVPDAIQHAVEELPDSTLEYLLGSRYCETDRLSDEAWRRFGNGPTGWARVQAVCDYVHNHIRFGYEHSRATRTAFEAHGEALGVCRDFTHLAITLVRCLNIPARYCTGYISDLGIVPPPTSPMDFCAWMEVFLGGRWHAFDPRNNAPRIGRILVARGRDAADVPLTHTFGPGLLTGFEVWIDEAEKAVAAG